MNKLNLSKLLIKLLIMTATTFFLLFPGTSLAEETSLQTVSTDKKAASTTTANTATPNVVNTKSTTAETTKTSNTVEPAKLTIDKEQYRSKIKDNLTEIKNCYEETLKTDKKAKGKTVIDFAIDDTGSVTTASLNESKSTLTNEALKECLITKIGKINFPAPPTGTTVDISYPFFFEPRKKGKMRILTK